jgi:hypothetical protein
MQIIKHPDEFKEGYRILMRCRRNKDGEGSSGGDRGSKKVITNGREEFEQAFESLSSEMLEGERIYSTVDARQMERGIRNFKQRQLEADYYDDGSRHSFYTDSHNRLVSCLQSPNARDSSYFLFDCDSQEDGLEALGAIDKLGLAKCIRHTYPTKSGRHIITDPFNPNLLPEHIRPWIQKNAMMLLAY